ncbi:MAG: hypothetical protein ABIY70_07945 [Capsulimonas sp.]|uniref:hypothetical protein n=1 Tax=Capsulimonas sp. TaxID=2494211 RepID=UPI003266E49D
MTTQHEFAQWFEAAPDPRLPQLQSTIGYVNSFAPDLWDHMDRIPMMPSEVGAAVLAELLELACQCQNFGNIHTGRYGLGRIPKEWLVLNIECAAEPILTEGGEWEYQRFLEFYLWHDGRLFQGLIDRGLQSDNPEIREAAEDMLQLKSSWASTP